MAESLWAFHDQFGQIFVLSKILLSRNRYVEPLEIRRPIRSLDEFIDAWDVCVTYLNTDSEVLKVWKLLDDIGKLVTE